MRNTARIGLVIPTLNEADAIGLVLAEVPDWVDQIVVADNGSTDRTVDVAQRLGAKTVVASRLGYGAACLSGIAALTDCDVIVFLDGDYSDYPQQMYRLVDPITTDGVQLVIGSRRLGRCERGSLTLPQRFGNWLACWLIWQFWSVQYTDLGPFRAIDANALRQIGMKDQAFGWTVEMQLRAIQEKLTVREVPVDYRARIGVSKISGTIRGTVLAGHAIIGTIIRTAVSDWRAPKRWLQKP
ncbi:glycosyltransferase family 2 protein [uncultured Roseovarius sp.]|uniref:glycosyltransferase family 2 protein n=1 Tax=uncultured Roseovarius sp. TaxID=293344 RepID=UPI002627E653|nr:glycosyltransferase family 2 protein [uncultured Roseovarius sp.]